MLRCRSATLSLYTQASAWPKQLHSAQQSNNPYTLHDCMHQHSTCLLDRKMWPNSYVTAFLLNTSQIYDNTIGYSYNSKFRVSISMGHQWPYAINYKYTQPGGGARDPPISVNCPQILPNVPKMFNAQMAQPVFQNVLQTDSHSIQVCPKFLLGLSPRYKNGVPRSSKEDGDKEKLVELNLGTRMLLCTFPAAMELGWTLDNIAHSCRHMCSLRIDTAASIRHKPQHQ